MEKFKKITDGYWISNLGNVRSTRKNPDGAILKGIKDKDGYLFVSIDKKPKKIHRLVANAFIDNPKNKPEVNHINGIKDDNTVKNLEWVTHKENFKHAIENNLLKEESKHYKTPFSDQDILNIFELSKTMMGKDIAKKYGVARSTISRILNGTRWKKTHKKIVNGKVR